MTLRTRAVFLTVVFTFGYVVWLSAAADITGKWTASFDTQIGEQRYTYEFKVTGSQLTAPPALRKTESPRSRTARSTATP
jgi:hypothetical protein